MVKPSLASKTIPAGGGVGDNFIFFIEWDFVYRICEPRILVVLKFGCFDEVIG